MNTLDFLFIRTAIPELEIIARLIVSLFLGGVIGFDREVKNRPAGLRTHMLVALAASIFSITTLEIIADLEKTGHTADPLRAIEAVTAGVAFLAAGTIIQSRAQISGLTTGASMWLAGAIGRGLRIWLLLHCHFGHRRLPSSFWYGCSACRRK